MSAAEQLLPWISLPMTWSEICKQYPDQWVCLAEADFLAPDSTALRSARVIGHGRRRRESLEQARQWLHTYRSTCLFFTGQQTYAKEGASL